jgi:hypothetical protein
MPAQLANHAESRPAHLALYRPPDFVDAISSARVVNLPVRSALLRQLATALRYRRDIHG